MSISRNQEGSFDAFCGFVGSEGTYAGVTKYLKEINSEIKGYFVEPVRTSAVAGKPITKSEHLIQGDGYVISNLSVLYDVPVDGFFEVSGEDAKKCA